jgi:hypothetical protein
MTDGGIIELEEDEVDVGVETGITSVTEGGVGGRSECEGKGKVEVEVEVNGVDPSKLGLDPRVVKKLSKLLLVVVT